MLNEYSSLPHEVKMNTINLSGDMLINKSTYDGSGLLILRLNNFAKIEYHLVSSEPCSLTLAVVLPLCAVAPEKSGVSAGNS